MTARLLLAYDGTGYAGWATQPGRRTVEETVAAALADFRGDPVKLTVAGRTDAGVHARGQVVSHAGAAAPSGALNARLPDDVRVLASDEVGEGFDARRDATSRVYRYRLLTGPEPDVFERDRAFHVYRALDVEALERCAPLVEGRHDFTAFTPTQGSHRHFERAVLRSEWMSESDRVLAYWIEADAFLHNMVRSLVGTMLGVARGHFDLDHFAGLLAGRPRAQGGDTAAARGLYLEQVRYGDRAQE